MFNFETPFRLDLFDGEGGQGGTQGNPGGTPSGGESRAAQTPGNGAGEGKQSPEGDASNPSDAGKKLSPEERRKAYRSMVDGEYKDLYTEDTQRLIDRRFKQTKTLEQQVANQQPILDMLMQRYKIADGDLGKLTKAIEDDNDYWSAAADEAGMSVEQYKQFQKLQRENEQLRRTQKQRQNQEAAQKQLQQWYKDAEEVKSIYPDFDLAAESQDREFLAMLKVGIPVRTAYEVKHMDKIKETVAQATAKQTEKQVVDGIKSKGSRPTENGTAGKSAFTTKQDVSKWTKKDRAEIARRVAMGEKIYL